MVLGSELPKRLVDWGRADNSANDNCNRVTLTAYPRKQKLGSTPATK